MDTDYTPREDWIKTRRVRKSTAYRAALARASKLLRNPEKLSRLINDAADKAARLPARHLGEFGDNLSAFFRLVRAYSNGEYREVSRTNLVLVVTALIYFLTPVDLVPDFLLALGYLDDAALITWTLGKAGEEIEAFLEWETHRKPPLSRSVEIADD